MNLDETITTLFNQIDEIASYFCGKIRNSDRYVRASLSEKRIRFAIEMVDGLSIDIEIPSSDFNLSIPQIYREWKRKDSEEKAKNKLDLKKPEELKKTKEVKEYLRLKLCQKY